MDNPTCFMQYAAAFEETFKDDDWSRLHQYFTPDAVYLLVAKISGNGAAANTIEASLFGAGAAIGNFTDPNFDWDLSMPTSASFNPILTQLQFTSRYQANYTVSNVWIGSASDFFAL